MEPRELLEILQPVADCLWCEPAELAGQTLRAVFTSCERNGATVYWGCWSGSQLDSRIIFDGARPWLRAAVDPIQTAAGPRIIGARSSK